MTRHLHISKDLALPPDTVTSTLIVYGGKGMGKTNFGSVLAEELSYAKLKFSVIDPMGVWWGLQNSKDGKHPGIEVLLLGGTRGDIPIEPSAGNVVADLVVDESVNVVIDISRSVNGKAWSRGERIKFVYEYVTRLYERQNEARRPLLQIIDESARFAPQMIPRGAEEGTVTLCLGALEQLVEEARNIGVGVCFLTQRSARLAKSVSELADCMVSFRIIGPRSIEAIEDWLGEHVEKEKRRAITEQLRQLPIGQALVVSPGWLRFEGVVPIRERETFDSSATPKPGSPRAIAAKAAKPDLDKYREKMKETVERAEANNPKTLRRDLVAAQKTITELEKKLERAQAKQPQSTLVKERVEVFLLREGHIRRIERYADSLKTTADTLLSSHGEIKTALAKLNGSATPVSTKEAAKPIPSAPAPAPVRTKPPERTKAGPVVEGEELAPREQKVLDALREFELLNILEVAKYALGVFAGRAPTSGSYDKDLGRLRANLELIEYPKPGYIRLTEKGRARAVEPEELRTLDDYHKAWFEILEPRKVKILKVLIPIYPNSLSKEELAEQSERGGASGSYDKDLGNLRTLGVIEYPEKKRIAAGALLFPPGLT